MSCCGNKRAPAEAWSDPAQAVQGAPIRESAPRVFEYVGYSSLMVAGVTTRRLYHFAFPGQNLEIAYKDSFAVMAEGDLKRV